MGGRSVPDQLGGALMGRGEIVKGDVQAIFPRLQACMMLLLFARC